MPPLLKNPKILIKLVLIPSNILNVSNMFKHVEKSHNYNTFSSAPSNDLK